VISGVHQLRDGTVVDDKHSTAGEVKSRGGEVRDLELAVETLAKPRRQIIDLIGGHFDEMACLAGIELMIARDFVDQLGALGGCPTAPT